MVIQTSLVPISEFYQYKKKRDKTADAVALGAGIAATGAGLYGSNKSRKMLFKAIKDKNLSKGALALGLGAVSGKVAHSGAKLTGTKLYDITQ